MLRRLLLLACGLNCFAISPAPAQETVLWRSIGQWQIRVDASLGYGCFLVGSYTRGTVLRIGIEPPSPIASAFFPHSAASAARVLASAALS